MPYFKNLLFRHYYNFKNFVIVLIMKNIQILFQLNQIVYIT